MSASGEIVFDEEIFVEHQDMNYILSHCKYELQNNIIDCRLSNCSTQQLVCIHLKYKYYHKYFLYMPPFEGDEYIRTGLLFV